MKNKLNNLLDKAKVKETIGTIAKEVSKLEDEAKNALANEKINEFASEASRVALDVASKTKEVMQDVASKSMDTASDVSSKSSEVANELITKSKDAYDAASSKVVSVLDQTGDGKVEIEDVIIMGLRVPGIRINRAEFLQAELQKHYPQDVIADAIEHNPAHAGIDSAVIDKIADEVIQFERVCVSGISAALGTPGGFAMAATIPADIAQYYGYMLRAAQKLMYLYGFPEIDTEEKGQVFDSETINLLIICIGVMYGAAGANNALKSMAAALGQGVKKKLMNAALTKGSLYPIVKSSASWFNVRLTKEVFSTFFEKAIPVVGGVIGGGITYLSFKPCCDKLKASLQDTMLSNPNYQPSQDDEIIDIECDLNE